MNNVSKKFGKKTVKLFKRMLSLVLAVALVTGFGLSYSADRVLQASELSEDEVAEVQKSAPEEKKEAPAPAPEPESEPAVETQEIVLEDAAVEEAQSDEGSSESEAAGDNAGEAAAENASETAVEEEIMAGDEEVLEEAEEVEEEEKEERPAQTLTARASDGASVTVRAPEGALPAGSRVVISVVSASSAIAAVDNQLGEDKEVVGAKAYDITIYDKSGKEIQPDSSVKVSITGAGVGGGEETRLYHMSGGSADKVADVAGSSASFSASHFSVYVFVEIDTAEAEQTDGVRLVLSDKLLKLESVGYTYQLEAKMQGYKGSMPEVRWSSADTSIATVGADGTVTAVANGSTSVTASVTIGEGDAAQEYTATTIVEVGGAETVSLVLNTNSVELGESGETTMLGASLRGVPEGTQMSEVTWSSSDESVATVDLGRVTAVGAGKTEITAKTQYEGKEYSASAVVTVKTAQAAVRIDPEQVSLDKGETADLTAVLVGAGENPEITWSTDNGDIVSVSADGAHAVITAEGVGKTKVTAKVVTNQGTLKASSSVSVRASGTWSNGTSEMNWAVDENGVLDITGSGELKAAGHKDGGFASTTDAEGEIGDTPWKDWRNSITEVVVGEGITTIGPRAFEGCQNLHKITFNNKDTLKRIGYQAFYRCHKLIEIDLSGCTSLEVLEGSGSDKGAFSHGSWRLDNYSTTVERSMIKIDLTGCTNLREIGGGAFYGRRYIDFDMSDLSGLEVIGKGALEDKHEFNPIDFTKLTSLTEVGYKALRNNTGVVNVDLSGNTNLTTIGEAAFLIEANFYSYLTNVDLSGCSNLTSIGKSAFGWTGGKGDKTLTSVDLMGTSITDIKDNTFVNQSALKYLSIPDKVTTISGSAFSGCSGITDVLWDAKDYTGNKGNLGSVFDSVKDKSVMTVTIGPDVEKLPADFFKKLDGATFKFTLPEAGTTRAVQMNLDGKEYKEYLIDSEGHIYLKTDESMTDLSDIMVSGRAPLWIEYETASDLVYNGENQSIVRTVDPAEGAKVQYKAGKNGEWTNVENGVVSVINAGIYELFFRLVSATEESLILEEEARGLTVTVDKAKLPVKVDTHAVSLKPGDAYDFSNRVSGTIPDGVTISYSFAKRSLGFENIVENYGAVTDFQTAGRTLNGSKYRAGTTTGVDVILVTLADANGNYDREVYKIPVRVEGEPRIYTATFNANGGTFTNDGGGKTYVASGPAGTRIIEPVPYRDGYRFTGWDTNVSATLMRDVTYKANWEKSYDVTLTAASGEKVFDGTPLTADEVSATGLPAGYTVKASASGSQTEVGTSSNTVDDGYVIMDANGNNANGSCKVTLKDGTLTVKPASVTVTIKGGVTEAVYDGSEHKASGYSVAGINSDMYTENDFSFSGSAEAVQTGVGTAKMGLEADQFVNNNKNFDNVKFEIEDGYVSVSPKSVTVTADNKSKKYGEDDPDLTAFATGLIEGDTLEYKVERAAGENVGDYTITPSGSAEQGNYTVSYVSGTLSISESDLTMEAVSYSGEYDGKPHSGGANASVTEDTVITYSTDGGKTWTDAAPSITDVGTVEYLAKAENPNYKPLTVPGRLTVVPKQITVKARDAEKAYGIKDPATFEADVKGLADNYTVDYEVSREPGENVREGGYTITPSGDAEQGNYHVSYEPGVFTIRPLEGVVVTVRGANEAVMYDGKVHTAKGFTSVANNELYERGDFEFNGQAEVSRRDAATEAVQMGLSAEQFTNTNPNFKDVRFDVTDGSLLIRPASATVNIIGKNNSAKYDGREHKVSGYDVETSSGLYSEADFTFDGTAEASRTNAGRTPMGLTADKFTNKNPNFDSVTFNVTDGYQEITAADVVSVTITGHHASVDYDGKAHEVKGYDVQISDPLYKESDFAFTGAADGTNAALAEGTDAGTYSMGLTAGQFENKNENFSKVVFNVSDGYLQINRINTVVTITGNTASADYDGEEHSVEGYTARANSALYDVKSAAFGGRAAAARTDAGTSSMGLTAEMFTNTDKNFGEVTFVVNDGYVTVEPVDVTVKIKGHNNIADYDGTEHEISGYDTEIGNELYTEADFTFSGTQTAARTDAGTTEMGLAAEQFTNNNSNFRTVTFDVTDGFQSILPVSTEVVINGHIAEAAYDGVAHTAEGYDVEINDPMYKETDFTFNGEASVSRTAAGTGKMGLSAEQFVNSNPNFSSVLFIINDGYVTVNPVEVTVYITGHSNFAAYDGQDHSVSGYDVTTGSPLYSAEDFTFTPAADAVMIEGEIGASRKTAGTTPMGLKAEQFTNNNTNFSTVTFNVTDGFQTITPADEVVVSITGHNSTVDYDGKTHSVKGYDVEISNPLYTEADFSFSGNDEASCKDAGTVNMGLKEDQFTNKNDNFSKVSFNVTDGYQIVNPVTAKVEIVGRSNRVDYDGKLHEVSGYNVREISTPLYRQSDIQFTGNDTVSRTEAGVTQMGLTADQFVNTNENFSAVEFEIIDGYMAVDPITAVVDITGHTGSADYDGSAHRVDGYDFSANTELYSGNSFVFNGSAEAVRTDAGTTNMGLSAEQFRNIDPNFSSVTFRVTDGYQTVEPVKAAVSVTGTGIMVPYDGQLHTAEGYTAVADNALLDTTKDIAFSGSASVSGINAGTADMGLAAEQFSCTNANFSDVTFTVTDGSLTITPVNAAVTITGRHDASVYDGAEHSVSGYDVEISNPLYSQKDFEFSGSAEAARTDEGTTEMGLAADQFTNKNENFANVTFDVTDGYQTITAVDEVLVTITGHRSTADYDGEEHAVSGYDVEISDPLYKESDFSFTGKAESASVHTGTVEMGLAPEQFANNNNNFSKVTFNVTDGGQTIVPVSTAVRITGNSDSAVYDGQDHAVSGYEAAYSNPLYGEKSYEFSGKAEATQKDAGTAAMGLAPEQFSNTDPDFEPVAFSVTDGTVTVKPAGIELTAASAEREYTGAPLTSSGYEVTGGEFPAGEGIASATVEGSQTLTGESGNYITGYEFAKGTAANNYIVTLEPGVLKVTDRKDKYTVMMKPVSDTVMYDGKEHSVSGFEGSEFTFAGETFTVSGLESNASGRNAGTYDVFITGTAVVTDRNGNDVTPQFDVRCADGSLTILRRKVVLASDSSTSEYTGNPIAAQNVTVGGDGFAEGEGAEYVFTGKQTIVGISENSFTYTLTEGTDAGNYDIVTEPGTLNVTSRDARYEVTVEPESAEFMYDGTEKTVTGLRSTEFMAGGNVYTVSGLEAYGAGTHAGEYPVNITGTAVVTDSSGNDVSDQFRVETSTGRLVIGTREVLIRSASESKVYDGNALTNGEVGVEGDGFAEGEGAEYVVSGSITAPGACENSFAYRLMENTLASDYEITAIPGMLSVTNRPEDAKYKVTIKAADGSYLYDGKEHTAEGIVDPSTGEAADGSIKIKVGGNEYTVSGLRAASTAVSAGRYPVNITGSPLVTDAEGNDVTDQFAVSYEAGSLTMAKRSAVLRSASATRAYNGKPLVSSDVEVAGDGFADGEGAEFKVTGSRTLVGFSPNSFTYTLNEGTSASNYDIVTEPGILTVTGRDAKYLLTVKPVGGEFEYDGEVKSVEGFETLTAEIGGARYEISGLEAGASATDPGVYTVDVKGTPVVTDADGNDVSDQFAVTYTNAYLTIKEAEEAVVPVEPGEPADQAEPADAEPGEPADQAEPADAEPTDAEEAEPADQAEPTDAEEAEQAEPTNAEEAEQADKNEPAGKTKTDNQSSQPAGQTGEQGGFGDEEITAESEVTNVEEALVPYTSAPLGAWALINLVAAVVTALGAVIALFRRKEDDDYDNDPGDGPAGPDKLVGAVSAKFGAESGAAQDAEGGSDNRGKKMLASKLTGALAGVAAPITFLMTEDMSLPMQMFDKWTLLMLVMLAVQIVAAILNKRSSKLEDDKEESASAY